MKQSIVTVASAIDRYVSTDSRRLVWDELKVVRAVSCQVPPRGSEWYAIAELKDIRLGNGSWFYSAFWSNLAIALGAYNPDYNIRIGNRYLMKTESIYRLFVHELAQFYPITNKYQFSSRYAVFMGEFIDKHYDYIMDEMIAKYIKEGGKAIPDPKTVKPTKSFLTKLWNFFK